MTGLEQTCVSLAMLNELGSFAVQFLASPADQSGYRLNPRREAFGLRVDLMIGAFSAKLMVIE